MVGGEDTTLAHQDGALSSLRKETSKVRGRCEIGGEAVEIAVIHPNDRGRNSQSARELFGGVHFNERGHAQLVGECEQFTEIGVAEGANDQQERISAIGTSLIDLVGVENEVLGKQPACAWLSGL